MPISPSDIEELPAPHAAGADGPVTVLMARLDLPPAAVDKLFGWLSPEETQRALRYHFDRDRRRFVVARACLRHLLAQRLHTRPECVELAYGTYGKPMLAGRFADSGWQFNLSHCDDIAVYAFTQSGRLGIDIEALRAVPDADAIAARFFSSRENAALRALDPDERLLGFINCWTRKEAFVKAVGDGRPYASFEVSLAPHEPPRLLGIEGLSSVDPRWLLHSFSPVDGFVAALVSESAPSA